MYKNKVMDIFCNDARIQKFLEKNTIFTIWSHTQYFKKIISDFEDKGILLTVRILVYFWYLVVESDGHFGLDFSCFHSSIKIVKAKSDFLRTVKILFCFDNSTFGNSCQLVFTYIGSHLNITWIRLIFGLKNRLTISRRISSNSSRVTRPFRSRSNVSNTSLVFEIRELASFSFVLELHGRKCARILKKQLVFRYIYDVLDRNAPGIWPLHM